MSEPASAPTPSGWLDPAVFLATCGGIGRVGVAPGTFGSLVGIPLSLATGWLATVGSARFGSGWLTYYRDKGVFMYKVPYTEPPKTPVEEMVLASVAPEAHAPYITAATLWLNGTNDHHGGHERGEIRHVPSSSLVEPI